LFDSLLNFFNQSKLDDDTSKEEDHLTLISGVLVEAAAVDGKIDESEISKIKKSLIHFFNISEEKSISIVNKSLEKMYNLNSLHYYTSKINKMFEYDKKIKLLEILWEIILSDGKVHDFESSLLRRISGLLYVSDVECGNAKKRASVKIKEK